MIHKSVQQYSVEFESVYKRKNFSTPKNYLDFISNYMKFLADKRKQCDFSVRRLEVGLATLEAATISVKEMSEVLAEKNAVIAEKKVVVEAIIVDINEKSEVAGVQQKAAAEKKSVLAVQQVEIQKEKEEAAEELKKAAPALAAAKLALQNIKSADIVEIKNLANPPDAVKLAITIAFHYYFRSSDDSWANVKLKMLMNSRLLTELQEYDIATARPDQAARCKKLLKQLRKDQGTDDPDELQKYMDSKSKAAGGLFKWATSTDSCFDIFQNVEPKRKKAEAMTIQLENANRDLAITEANLKELNDSLAVLNAEAKIKKDELDELEAQSAMMTRKLNAASKLITGLGSEQTRWSADMKRFEEDKIKLVGDCLTASSFLSYSGPFNFILR
jgi:dynein heavy chain